MSTKHQVEQYRGHTIEYRPERRQWEVMHGLGHVALVASPEAARKLIDELAGAR